MLWVHEEGKYSLTYNQPLWIIASKVHFSWKIGFWCNLGLKCGQTFERQFPIELVSEKRLLLHFNFCSNSPTSATTSRIWVFDLVKKQKTRLLCLHWEFNLYCCVTRPNWNCYTKNIRKKYSVNAQFWNLRKRQQNHSSFVHQRLVTGKTIVQKNSASDMHQNLPGIFSSSEKLDSYPGSLTDSVNQSSSDFKKIRFCKDAANLEVFLVFIWIIHLS